MFGLTLRLSASGAESVELAVQAFKPNGMGVGLSVCRTIIEAHGGELRAEDGTGGGTLFLLTLPRHSGAPC